MPGLAQKQPLRNDNNNKQFSNGNSAAAYSLSSNGGGGGGGSISLSVKGGFWSKHRGDVSYNQLQKFWNELSPQARQQLLRIDKQALFEQARKNIYCARCNGLLLEGFLQIVMYGKSLQHEGAGEQLPCNRLGALKNQNNGDLCMRNGCQADAQDPSVHPWGGLTTTRDGTLTLLDCYLYSKYLKGLQNVFDSARARERERELLYPDACGGGGRGWISQGMASYGRGHGTRETCALHTARLSVDTLVDFWSALGEETRQSLLRMKEEDFIERLMYRFDSKRFCRDCRRNVIREFKELKELKRIRRETRCTTWFCVADTGFQYEVSDDTVQADWQQIFIDAFGTYHHFEWAVGTGEGKSDILGFENVGLSGKVQVNGLDLSGLSECYITLRAWKMDGRCTELSVKAHALKGQECVHCRLVVGDGFVTITRGENIRRFFEHAEEAEEEEDDDSMDKDGNEMDGECSRPQKHAKSPELAREFLLDAATVIFKEQVEKAFREGTARQNAHSIFVSLALKLLEERVHVACKEIITLEKQMKLLEEEEKEKREEEERKERRRTKERVKKLRRKERLREKEKDKEKKCPESNQLDTAPDVPKEESTSVDEELDIIGTRDLVTETGEEAIFCLHVSPDISQDEENMNGYISSNMRHHSDDSPDGGFSNIHNNGSFAVDISKYSRRKLKYRKDFDPSLKWSDKQQFTVVSESCNTICKSEPRYQGNDYVETSTRSINGLSKQSRSNTLKSNMRNGGPKFGERLNSMNDRYDLRSCSCYQQNDYRAKVEPHSSIARVGREAKSVSKSGSALDMSKPYHRGNKYNQVEYMRESFGKPRSKHVTVNNHSTRDSPHNKQVWEPMEAQKKYPRSTSDSDVTMRSSTFKIEPADPDKLLESSGPVSSSEATRKFVEIKQEDTDLKESQHCRNGFLSEQKSLLCLKEEAGEEVELCPMVMTASSLTGTMDPSCSTSNSGSCSSCLSEGESNVSSSPNPQNPESSSTSDSELSEGQETSQCLQNGFTECHESSTEKKQSTDGGTNSVQTKVAQNHDSNGKPNLGLSSQPQAMLQPPLPTQSIHFPVFQAPSMGYYHQNLVPWPPGPANGLMPLPHLNHYVFASPFGYGLNGDSRFMPYGTLQHLAPPWLNPGQTPVYHPVSPANGVHPNKHAEVPDLGGVAPKAQRPVEAPPTKAEVDQNGNSERPQVGKGNAGFSLFHFGGPVALSTGYKSNSVPSKEGGDQPPSSNRPAHHIESDHHASCNKKDGVEEYNLFAASNGIRFSFF